MSSVAVFSTARSPRPAERRPARPLRFALGYRTHSFIATRQGSKLTIGLNFPLSSGSPGLTLYEIQSSPVPVPGDHNILRTSMQSLTFLLIYKTTLRTRIPYLSTQTDLKDNIFLFGQQQPQPLPGHSKRVNKYCCHSDS